MKILVVVLCLAIIRANIDSNHTNTTEVEEGGEVDMKQFDNLLARFDKDSNGKLSVDQFMKWMQEMTQEQGGFYEADYYDLIKQILGHYLDQNKELNREGAMKMQESIEAGKYDQLFASYFEKYTLNPSATEQNDAL